jgi:type I restriction enzyme, S subunit
MSDQWRLLRLSDHFEIAIGGTPSRSSPPYWAEKPAGFPWIAIGDLKSKNILDTKEHISELGVASSNVKLIPTGSTVMSFKLSVGRTAITSRPMYSNEAIAAFLPRSDAIDSGWLYHVLPRVASTVIADTAVKGVTLNKSKLDDMVALAPNISEQRTISKILDTLDITIRQTEAIIEKLKQVKQGLLHDLLTRGIDANGELRPPQSEAPELYKESALGWIPRGWNVSSLKEILAPVDPAMRSGPFGSALLKDELVSSGYPLLGIDNVQVEHFLAEFSRFVTEKKFNELARYAVRPHDLMITIMGTVGRCCTVPEDIGNALSSKHTWTLTLDQTKYIPTLAMLQINYAPWILKQFAEDEQGGIMSAIRSDALRKLILPTPPIEEQHEIELRLNSITNRIEAESVSLAKSKLEKSGLMDDLLTGRVRVTPLLNTPD